MTTTPGITDCPYELYRTLRASAPVHYAEHQATWLVMGADDVTALLAEMRLDATGVSPHIAGLVARSDVAAAERLLLFRRYLGRSMLGATGGDHARYRWLFAGPLSADAVRAQVPAISRRVRAVLDSLGRRSEFDVMTDLAEPVAELVLADLLGMPVRDCARFRAWTDAVTAASLAERPEEVGRRVEAADDAYRALHEYLVYRLHRARDRGEDSMLGRLARHEGRGLTRDELVANVVAVYLAGLDSLTGVIGNALHTLVTHRYAWQSLVADPARAAATAEEILRYETPLLVVHRKVLDDFSYAGHRFRRQETVALVLGAANRDGRRHPGPDNLDPDRADSGHVSFGGGPHRCVGAELATEVLRVVLQETAIAFPRLGARGFEADWSGGEVRRTPTQFVVSTA